MGAYVRYQEFIGARSWNVRVSWKFALVYAAFWSLFLAIALSPRGGPDFMFELGLTAAVAIGVFLFSLPIGFCLMIVPTTIYAGVK